MATKKATEAIWGAMHTAGDVVLGHGWEGQPAAKATLFTSPGNSTSIAFEDPDVLRQIAADFLKAAEYIETEPRKEVAPL